MAVGDGGFDESESESDPDLEDVPHEMPMGSLKHGIVHFTFGALSVEKRQNVRRDGRHIVRRGGGALTAD